MYVFAKHISKLFQTFWNHLISRIELQNDFWEYSNVATSIQTQLRAFVSRKKCRPIIETCRLKFRFYGIQITDSRNINFFRFWTLLTVQVLNSEFKFESSVKIYLESVFYFATTIFPNKRSKVGLWKTTVSTVMTVFLNKIRNFEFRFGFNVKI